MRTLRVATVAVGVGLIGYGVYGLLHDSYIRDPLDVLIWLVGGLVLHDGLWVPLLCVLGASFVRGPVLRGWLVVAAAVTAVALPLILRDGHNGGNASVLPLPYLRNWLLVLAATAAVAALAALCSRTLRRRKP
ncbi:hypothetical protein [Kitasatospora sp. GP82]|uniref:hypothetical protein n=1 Tax=Kitasatospora sp. GP82 TaxID=3035089 RepID=UPI002474DBF0|nr:hypothetical protein [Kitasatospora sp. GP82]MDH6127454.1 hypothetical protein [Kitasatospora sp. GP82]